VFDRVSGLSFAEQMRGDMANLPRYLQILVRLHWRIHTHSANQLSSLKVWLATDIARTMLLDEPRKQLLLSGLARMPDDDRLCHGDFHPMNVLSEASRPIVIDWPNAVSRKFMLWDVVRRILNFGILGATVRVFECERKRLLPARPYLRHRQHRTSRSTRNQREHEV
jgi:hypothetical protein